jgi:hypothetical protein
LRKRNFRKPSHTKPPPEFVFFTDRDLGNHVPDALEAAGYRVERHSAHFPHDIPDPDLIPEIGKHRDWVALTKDKRQRYNTDERDAIMRCGVALFIHAGRLAHPDLAKSFVIQAPRILHFREKHDPPFIAKVYRPVEKTAFRTAPGRIEMKLTQNEWREMVARKMRG